MALTDSNITAKNFKKFYEAIKPYLTGHAETGCVPVGSIIMSVGLTAPIHYLICDGKVYNINDYPELAIFIEDQYGSKNYFGGDGLTTFAVPDLFSGADDIPLISLTDPEAVVLFCIAYQDVFVDPSIRYQTNEQLIGAWEDRSPLYQVSITGTTPDAVEGTIQTGLTGIAYAEIVRFQVNSGNYVRNLLDSVGIKPDGTEIGFIADTDSVYRNKTFYATIHYKKAQV